MSAARIDLVLEAARLMRERAQAATPGPWTAETWGVSSPSTTVIDDGDSKTQDLAHIASWHPAVALAVADWLAATHADFAPIWTGPHVPPDLARALAVARAYLGRDS